MAKKPADPGLLTEADLQLMKADLEKSLGGKLFWGNDEKLRLKFLPLGILPFDAALSGGLAFDRVVLVYGEFSTGKTLFAMQAMKAAQHAGLSVAFIDVEKTWTPEWAEKNGIDSSKVLVTRPRTGEEAFQQGVELVKRRIGVVVIDSLGALTAAEITAPDADERFDKLRVGGTTARLIGEGLGAMMSENDGSLIIALNQLRTGIGTYGNPDVLPGGRKQKFVAWQVIRTKRRGWLEEGTGDKKKRVGYKWAIVVEKNKQDQPFVEAEIDFRFTGEVDESNTVLDLAVDLGIVEANNAWLRFGDLKWFGRQKFMDQYREDDHLRLALENAIDAVAPRVDL